MNNIMLDIETMGNTPNSAIVAIGAVRFSSRGISDSFQVTISLKSSLDAGLEVDASTVMWWMKQSEDARFALSLDTIRLSSALISFSKWIGDNVIMWGNGSAFDNVILANSYRKLNYEVPWKFWNDRCYRTVKNMFPNTKIIRMGTHHNALHDAQTQAGHLLNIFDDNDLGLL